MEKIRNVSNLNDKELREALVAHNKTVGPITDSTRELYRKTLISAIEKDLLDSNQVSTNPYEDLKKSLVEDGVFDSESSQDEDFMVDDDDEEDDEDFLADDIDDPEDDDDEDDDEDESDDESIEDSDESHDEVATPKSEKHKLKNISNSSILETAPNRIAKVIRNTILAFFLAIFIYYAYSRQLFNDIIKGAPPFKALTRHIILLSFFTPIVYLIYKAFGYYKKRKHQEMEKICDIVTKAIELLQSPENPKLVPILHIRDTLLNPSERKSPKSMKVWAKAVKFIEENESRVKSELVSINGEEFMAWTWIGARKL